MSNLIMFYGDGCGYCDKMMPIVLEAEKELGIVFDKKEIWNNNENKEEFKALRGPAEESCGGLLIPSFYSKKTNKMICREHSIEELKEWMRVNS